MGNVNLANKELKIIIIMPKYGDRHAMLLRFDEHLASTWRGRSHRTWGLLLYVTQDLAGRF